MLFQTIVLDRFPHYILPHTHYVSHGDIPHNTHHLILFDIHLFHHPHILADTWDGSFLHSMKSHLTEHPLEKSHRVATEWIEYQRTVIDMLERIST